MQMDCFEKVKKVLLKLYKLQNYFFANVLSISGYCYWVVLHKLNEKAAIIYAEPGADTTSEGIMHTFECTTWLANFMLLWLSIIILCIIEHIVKKRFFNKNSKNVVIIPVFIKVLHSILFWIGLWTPLWRVLLLILCLILLPIYELFSNFL